MLSSVPVSSPLQSCEVASRPASQTYSSHPSPLDKSVLSHPSPPHSQTLPNPSPSFLDRATTRLGSVSLFLRRHRRAPRFPLSVAGPEGERMLRPGADSDSEEDSSLSPSSGRSAHLNSTRRVSNELPGHPDQPHPRMERSGWHSTAPATAPLELALVPLRPNRRSHLFSACRREQEADRQRDPRRASESDGGASLPYGPSMPVWPAVPPPPQRPGATEANRDCARPD